MSVRIENWNDIRELVLMSIGTDKGTWWADPAFGSELWLLRRNGRIDGQTAGTARRMMRECLQWLVEDGLAKEISCDVERAGKNALSYMVTVTRPDGGGAEVKGVWDVV
ncbi:MAG: phage GP46 family protein [Treponematales bacterium]